MITLILARITENSELWVEILGGISAILETLITSFYTIKAIVNKVKDFLISRAEKKEKENKK